MIERFIDGGILNRGGTIKEMQESEEKYNRLTKVIEDYGVESFVEVACSFCNNVAANIFTEKYFLNIKMKKENKIFRQNMSRYQTNFQVHLVSLSMVVLGEDTTRIL